MVDETTKPRNKNKTTLPPFTMTNQTLQIQQNK
jgi:hypothetical protein